jgi:hypothetical protein
MGVAGRVFNLSGSPIQGQQVMLNGVLAGVALPPTGMITLTGLATQYGPNYYEFTLAEEPVASSGTLWLQLLDQSGVPVSEKIFFDTYADCDRNLIIIDFEQVR